MIYFNGNALENVAPIKIEDIRVSPVQLDAVARDRPLRPGSELVRVRPAARTAEIIFALLDKNREQRQAQLRAITQWARSDGEGTLLLPLFDGAALHCVCTAAPEPSFRQWWESKLRLVFTCFSNPFWTSTTETSVPFGTAFTIGGSAPPLVRITRTVPSTKTNQSYSDGTDTMTFSTIPAGSLVIDINNQTAAVSGVSIMQYYTFGSAFPTPKIGTQTWTGEGAVKYRERWE